MKALSVVLFLVWAASPAMACVQEPEGPSCEQNQTTAQYQSQLSVQEVQSTNVGYNIDESSTSASGGKAIANAPTNINISGDRVDRPFLPIPRSINIRPLQLPHSMDDSALWGGEDLLKIQDTFTCSQLKEMSKTDFWFSDGWEADFWFKYDEQPCENQLITILFAPTVNIRPGSMRQVGIGSISATETEGIDELKVVFKAAQKGAMHGARAMIWLNSKPIVKGYGSGLGFGGGGGVSWSPTTGDFGASGGPSFGYNKWESSIKSLPSVHCIFSEYL